MDPSFAQVFTIKAILECKWREIQLTIRHPADKGSQFPPGSTSPHYLVFNILCLFDCYPHEPDTIKFCRALWRRGEFGVLF